MNTIKIKIAIIVLLGIGVLSKSVAVNASWRPVPDLTGVEYKNTADNYSVLSVGDISTYADVKACSESYYSPIGIIISSPPEICGRYSTNNLTYIDGFPAYVGQQIKLRLVKTLSAYNQPYQVEVLNWDYR